MKKKQIENKSIDKENKIKPSKKKCRKKVHEYD